MIRSGMLYNFNIVLGPYSGRHRIYRNAPVVYSVHAPRLSAGKILHYLGQDPACMQSYLSLDPAFFLHMSATR